jgi:hypothetical protein
MPIHKCLWYVFDIGSKGQTAAKLDVGLGSTRFKCSGLSLWLSGKAFSGVFARFSLLVTTTLSYALTVVRRRVVPEQIIVLYKSYRVLY